MRTLITGSTGFIGSSYMKDMNLEDIHILSRQARETNTEGIVSHFGDIRDKEFLSELAKLRFERIIHFAWQGLPSLTPENNAINLEIAIDFFDAMRQSGVREINVTGSCLEYGDLKSSVTENNPGSNVNDFGKTKLTLLDYLDLVQIPYRWFRIFYAYGPRQHLRSLLYSVYQNTINGIPLGIQNPKTSHDFIYVGDVARAIGMLLSTPDSYGVFNIGSSEPNSVGKMVNLLLDAIGSVERVEEDRTDCLLANIDKIQSICEWSPQVSVEEGVTRFLEWCETQ